MYDQRDDGHHIKNQDKSLFSLFPVWCRVDPKIGFALSAVDAGVEELNQWYLGKTCCENLYNLLIVQLREYPVSY